MKHQQNQRTQHQNLPWRYRVFSFWTVIDCCHSSSPAPYPLPTGWWHLALSKAAFTSFCCAAAASACLSFCGLFLPYFNYFKMNAGDRVMQSIQGNETCKLLPLSNPVIVETYAAGDCCILDRQRPLCSNCIVDGAQLQWKSFHFASGTCLQQAMQASDAFFEVQPQLPQYYFQALMIYTWPSACFGVWRAQKHVASADCGNSAYVPPENLLHRQLP